MSARPPGHDERDQPPSSPAFDKKYWDARWRSGEHAAQAMSSAPPNPHLVREMNGIPPGAALEAGCGAGTEAIWLASAGWRVVGVDISAAALRTAAAKSHAAELDDRIDWIEADLSTWEPERLFDLVTTHYAHPSMPQLDFYERLAEWVAPGGTLLIVGHLGAPEHEHGHAADHDHDHRRDHDHGADREHGHDRVGDPQPPHEATATADSITSRLDRARWQIVTAQQSARVVPVRGGGEKRLRDVVVRARRRR